MTIIEIAVRGDDPRLDKIADAIIYGLREQKGATPWKVVASLTNHAGAFQGSKTYTNEGRGSL